MAKNTFNQPPWEVMDYYEFDPYGDSRVELGIYDVYPEDKVTKESHEYNKKLIKIAPLMYQLLEKMLKQQEEWDATKIEEDSVYFDRLQDAEGEPKIKDFFWEIHRLVCLLKESSKFEEN